MATSRFSRILVVSVALVAVVACVSRFAPQDAATNDTEPAEVVEAGMRSHGPVGAGATQYAVPIGEAGTTPLMCGTYPFNLLPFCLSSVCAPGTFLGGLEGGVMGCAIPTGDGGSVATFVPGGDLYPGSGAGLTDQRIHQITGEAGVTQVLATGADFNFAADAAPAWTQTQAADGGGATMQVEPQACSNLATNTSSGGETITLGVPCGDAGEAALTVQRVDGGAVVVASPRGFPKDPSIFFEAEAGTSAIVCDNNNGGSLDIAAPTGQAVYIGNGAGDGNTSTYVPEVAFDTPYMLMFGVSVMELYASKNIQFGQIGGFNALNGAPHTFNIYGEAANPSSTVTPWGGNMGLVAGQGAVPGSVGGAGHAFLSLQEGGANGLMVVDAYEPLPGVRGVSLGGLGSGLTSSDVSSGDGWTHFAVAHTVPTVAPGTGTLCWSAPSTNALTCWTAGAGAPFVVGASGGGGDAGTGFAITQLHNDVVASGPGNASATVEGWWSTAVNSNVASATADSPVVYNPSGGLGASWQAAPLNLGVAASHTGVLDVPHGGTGLSSPGSAGNCILSTGSGYTSTTCPGGGGGGALSLSGDAVGSISGTNIANTVSHLTGAGGGNVVTAQAIGMNFSPSSPGTVTLTNTNGAMTVSSSGAGNAALLDSPSGPTFVFGSTVTADATGLGSYEGGSVQVTAFSSTLTLSAATTLTLGANGAAFLNPAQGLNLSSGSGFGTSILSGGSLTEQGTTITVTGSGQLTLTGSVAELVATSGIAVVDAAAGSTVQMGVGSNEFLQLDDTNTHSGITIVHPNAAAVPVGAVTSMGQPAGMFLIKIGSVTGKVPYW